LRILVTNDDSINAPGLWTLAESLASVGEVSIVAPDRDQSGIGTARTLLDILRVSEVETRITDVPAYAVSGTPADCVILAIEAIFDEPFDLVVSGINEGANLGLDVLDSGTVGGAMRGFFRGIPSIAMSVTSVTGVLYEAAAQVAKNLARAVTENGSRPLLYNVNVPNLQTERLKGVQTTFLGPKAFLENVESGHDGRRTHYWIRHNKPIGKDVPEGCDVWATRRGWVSITPMDPGLMSGVGLAEFSGLAKRVAAGMGLECG
jgi:5'-nucleotidase